jgi:hypothetical protein
VARRMRLWSLTMCATIALGVPPKLQSTYGQLRGSRTFTGTEAGEGGRGGGDGGAGRVELGGSSGGGGASGGEGGGGSGARGRPATCRHSSGCIGASSSDGGEGGAEGCFCTGRGGEADDFAVPRRRDNGLDNVRTATINDRPIDILGGVAAEVAVVAAIVGAAVAAGMAAAVAAGVAAVAAIVGAAVAAGMAAAVAAGIAAAAAGVAAAVGILAGSGAKAGGEEEEEKEEEEAGTEDSALRDDEEEATPAAEAVGEGEGEVADGTVVEGAVTGASAAGIATSLAAVPARLASGAAAALDSADEVGVEWGSEAVGLGLLDAAPVLMTTLRPAIAACTSTSAFAMASVLPLKVTHRPWLRP